MDVRTETQSWYRRYYEKHGASRNDPLTDPGVLLQNLATQAAVIAALRTAALDRSTAQVLDVGCGEGASLALLTQLQFDPANLHGIDVLTERIAAAERLHPAMRFHCGDAAEMPYETGHFDLVMESTMFVQLTNEEHAKKVASEMYRTSRRYVLVVDWRYGKAGYRAVTRKRIRTLFPACTIVSQHHGALVPPIGRALSAYLPAAYFPVRALLPFLTGLTATLLRK